MPPWLHHAALVWWSNLLANTWRYALFVVVTWALIRIVLKAPLRNRKIREEDPRARQMALEFLASMCSIAVFATSAALMTLMSHAGWYRLSHFAHVWGPAWFWTSIVLMILAHDTYYYWTHRAMHELGWLRRHHRLHHRSHNPSPFTAYSFDVGEAAILVSFVVIWPFLAPTSFAAIPFFILHQIARNTTAHCGYELMPVGRGGRPMFDWMTSVTHHDLHHAEPGSNFGLYFTWWDRWMGTENRSYHAAFAQAVRPRPERAVALPAQA